MAHPADEMVRSAHAALVRADEYLIPADAPIGALVKADTVKMGLDAQKDGKIRLTCGSWEDARVLLPGQMLAIRRESTFYVISRIDVATLQPVPQGDPMVDLGETPTPASASHAIGQLAHNLKRRIEDAGVLVASEVEAFVTDLKACYHHLEGAVPVNEQLPATPAAAPAPVPGVDVPSVDLLLHEVAGLRSAIASRDTIIAALTAKIGAATTPASETEGEKGPTLTGEPAPINPEPGQRLPADTVLAQPPTTPYPEGCRDPVTNPAPTAAEVAAQPAAAPADPVNSQAPVSEGNPAGT